MTRGQFITFEGIDGVGKSTQAHSLAKWLREEHNIRVVETREPGGTPFGEKLREILLSFTNRDVKTETLLMFASRCELLQTCILPAIERGEWVICDRFTDSTLAYQGGGRGLDNSFINMLAQSIHSTIWPNLTFYLRTELSHLSSSLSNNDKFEIENSNFYHRVHDEYNHLAEKNPDRVVIIDAYNNKKCRKSVETVGKEIFECVRERFL